MRELRNTGHECVLLATSDKPGLRKIEIDGISTWLAGIRNIYWPYHKNRPSAPLRMIWHLVDCYNPMMQSYIRKVVAEEKPDVVSVHNLPGWSVASWRTLKKLHVPMVQVLHDHYNMCIKTTCFHAGRNCVRQCATCHALRLLHRRFSSEVNAVVGVSRYILDHHRSFGYFGSVPIQRVIHNIRVPEILGTDVQSAKVKHDGFRFGFIGGLYPAKGIEYLIEAFRTANLLDTELWVAGSGKQDYEVQLRKHPCDPRIHFMGRVSPKDFYPHVDIVVVPSLLNDNLPGVVIESLAFGKPVIGSRRGGIPEMIVDGYNGLLFEPENLSDFAACLSKIYSDGDLYQYLEDNAKASSKQFLDVSRWIMKYEAVYSEVQRAPGL